MSKKAIFNTITIISVVMMMFGGALVKKDCDCSGAIIFGTGVLAFLLSPILADKIGKNDPKDN